MDDLEREDFEFDMGFVPMAITGLFPTSISTIDVNRRFHSIGQELEKCDIADNGPGKYGSQSENTYILDDEKYSEFQKYIIQAAEQYARDILCYEDTELFMTQSWVNVAHKGQEFDRHHHANSFISGVYYWQDDITPLTFVKTPIELWIGQICPNYNPEKFDMYPDGNPIREWPVRKNQMVLFESSLIHQVGENKSDVPRYSLAFNLFPKTLGDKRLLNELKVFKDK